MAIAMIGSIKNSVSSGMNTLLTSPAAQRWSLKYRQLSERDQWALKLLGMFLISAIVVYLLIIPAKSFAEKAKNRYQANKETVQWIQANKSAFATSDSSQVQARADQTLLSLASAAAQNYGMSFKRFEPVDDTSLRLWLEDVNFASVIQWVEVLDKTYNIVLTDVAVDQTAGTGRVNATVVLQE